MIALLDLDVYCFRCAASSENEESSEPAILRCDKWLRDTLQEVNTEEYIGFLTGKNNFRKILYPEYKANRKDRPKPKYLEEVRQFVVDEWSAQVSEGCEADDSLGTHQTDGTVIVSNDKDLLQIPGLHYNPVKKESIEVGHYEGNYNFWQQMLMGDRADNVPGYDGVARATVPKFISKMMSLCEDFEYDIFHLYEDRTQFFINYNLLHIWRKDQDYQCPEVIQKLLTGMENYKPDQDLTLDSSLMITNYLNKLSAPTGQEVSGS